MSLIYAAGVKATALTNIKAAIDARTSTLSDGSKQVDVGSLMTWIAEQSSQMLADGEVVDPNAAAEVVQKTSQLTQQPVTKYANYIKRSNWEDHPKWPASSLLDQAGTADLAVRLKNEVKALSDQITAHHTGFFKTENLKVATQQSFDEFGLKSNLPDAVTRIIDTRFYIATYVNDRDEESAPSAVSELLEVDQNDFVEVTVPSAPAGRNITGYRLYRSNTGSQSAAFQLVADATAANAVLDDGAFRYFDIATLSYTDNQKASELQEVCPTVTWLEPPAALKGLVGMPNGIMAGFSGNFVAFCEPYIPYAWPVEYQITTEHPIVSMAVFGQTLVVGTQGTPYFISGADSASMSAQKMQSNQACVSARSMVGVDGGVVYASPDGLCLASGDGIRVITGRHFTREGWNALVPSSIVAAYHEGTYYFTHTNGAGCYALHLGTGKLTTVSLTGSALYVDKLTDTLYRASGTSIIACFGAGTRRTAIWRSHIHVSEQQHGFAWLKVIGADASVIVRWYGDGALRHTVTLTNANPVRLPFGRYLEHEIEVESAGKWAVLTIASTTQELQAV